LFLIDILVSPGFSIPGIPKSGLSEAVVYSLIKL